MGTNLKLSEIKSRLSPEKEALIIDGDTVMIVNRNTSRLLKLFVKAGHRYAQVDLIECVKFIAEKLKDKVNVQKFLEELIALHSSPEEILELHERLQKPGASVKGSPQCYSIMVGGKPGRPYEFVLVSDVLDPRKDTY